MVGSPAQVLLLIGCIGVLLYTANYVEGDRSGLCKLVFLAPVITFMLLFGLANLIGVLLTYKGYISQIITAILGFALSVMAILYINLMR